MDETDELRAWLVALRTPGLGPGGLREASLAAPLPVTPNCAFLGPCYANIEPHITCDGWMTPCYLSPVKLFAILETPPETMREHLRRKRLAFQDTCGRGAWLRPTAAPLSAAG